MDYLIAIAVTLIYFMGGSFTYALLSVDPNEDWIATLLGFLWPAFWAIIALSAVAFAPIVAGLWAGSKVKERLK